MNKALKNIKPLFKIMKHLNFDYKNENFDNFIPLCIGHIYSGRIAFLNNDYQTYSYPHDDQKYDYNWFFYSKFSKNYEVLEWVDINVIVTNPYKYLTQDFQLKINFRYYLNKQ